MIRGEVGQTRRRAILLATAREFELLISGFRFRARIFSGVLPSDCIGNAAK